MRGLNEPWWLEQRRRQYRLKRKLPLEKIIRKCFCKCLKEYANGASMVILYKIFSNGVTKLSRLFYIIIFPFLLLFFIYYLNVVYTGTLSNPLTVKLVSATYPIGEIDFPAIAFCNTNRISKKGLRATALVVKGNSIYNHKYNNISKIENILHKMGNLITFTYSDDILRNPYLNLLSKKTLNTRLIISAMKRMAPDCDEMMKKCAWDGEVKNCSELFHLRRTVRGHCCIFNYVLDYNSGGRPTSTIATPKRQNEPGRLNGLHVVLDPLVNDQAFLIQPIQGFEVMLFEPTHYGDPNGGRVITRFAEPNQLTNLKIKSLKQKSTNEVRKYSIGTRKCYFEDELPEYNGMYSYSACILECKIRTIFSLCKCIPYFMPADNHSAVCTMEDLRCLNKFKEKLLNVYPYGGEKTPGLEVELRDSLYCPECLPSCGFTYHNTKASKTPIRDIQKQFRNKTRVNFFSSSSDINLTGCCVVSVYQSSSDGLLVQLDVVSYWYEIISNVGGFAGILFGFSFIGILEIVYFLIIRFPLEIFICIRNNKI